MKSAITILLAIFWTCSLHAQKHEYQSPVPANGENVFHKVRIELGQLPSGEELARILQQELSILQRTESTLKLTFFKESPHAFYFTFDQYYKDNPIHLAGIKAIVNKDFIITAVLDHLVDFTNKVQGDFTIDPIAAESFIWENEAEGIRKFEIELHREYLAIPSGLLPIYRAQTFADYPKGAYEIIYDANNMDELSRSDIAVYHGPESGRQTPVDTTCPGKVFDPDPLTSALVTYGGNYIDNNDADSPFLNAWRKDVMIRDITFDGSLYHLDGPYARILDIESPNKSPYSFTTCEMNYLRNADEFEGIMAYYHIDAFQRYVQGLGFNDLTNHPIKIDPHAMNGADNSRFLPRIPIENSELFFGEGGVDDAEDADVLIHEYGHALSHWGSPGSNTQGQRPGLDEGIGDYFATSYSKEISNYNWSNVFSWDGYNEFWPGRTAVSTEDYQTVNKTNIYDVGELWNSSLMRVYDIIGRKHSDKNALEELYMNFPNMTLNDAAHAIIEADSLVYGGYQTATYQNAFCHYGIFTGPECLVGIEDEIIMQSVSWKFYPNPSTTQLTIHVPTLSNQDQASIKLYDLMGRQVAHHALQDVQTIVQLPELKSGMYQIVLSVNGVRTKGRNLMIGR